MNNPWHKLPQSAPYILATDKNWIEEYAQSLYASANKLSNSQVRENTLYNYSLRTDILPFPYYGDPHNSTVFVLQANPGYDPKWQKNSLSTLILKYDRANLLHQNKIPLCYTQPATAKWKYNDGSENIDWYWQRTKKIREIVGWEAVAHKLTYLEMFPYRSIKLRYPKKLPPSQQYTFHLLREALKRNVWIIITRMETDWIMNVPELVNYPKLICLHSKQNVTLSPGNMGNEFFNFLCEELKAYTE